MYQAPTVTIQVVYPGPAQESSLFDLTVTSESALNPLFPASGTVYDAWCLNLLAAINAPGTYVAGVYATNEAENMAVNVPPLANGLLLENLDSVNWLLNYYDGTNAGISYGEVQGAIWKLMGQDWTQGARVLGQVDAADVDALAALALANDGYVAAAGETIGVVIAPNGNFVQPLIIETKAAALGNRVWADTDGDGVQDAGEAGIAGATVSLVRDLDGDGQFTGAGEVIATTTTNSQGNYLFQGLAPGVDYQVRFTLPNGFDAASPRQADGSATSDTNSDGLLSGVVVLAPGATNNTIDSGFYKYASLGDRVWLDTDKDGQQDANEVGVANVTVNLLDAAGNVVATQVTGGTGNYLFLGLNPGQYSVQFVAPTGFDFTTANSGADASDSDADTLTGRTQQVTLLSGDDNRTVDAGLVAAPPAPGTISGVVLEDLNNDGTGDTPIPGVTVVLKDSAGNPVATTTTGPDGSYSFAGVPPGQYTVEETNKPGYNDVGDTDGGNPNTISVTLPAGGTSAGNNFVDDRKATLGDRVWLDTDKDGQQDANEAGVAGVTVNLLNAAGTVVGTQTTNAQGNYLFTELDAGTYSVEFVKPNGLDFTSTDTGADGSDSDADTTTGRTGPITLQSGDDDRTVDAGLVAAPVLLGTISGVVLEDLNNDDLGDRPIAGVTVVLKDSAGNPVATAVTGTDGSYTFDSLPEGNYTVEQTNLPGYNDVGDVDGGNPNAISVALPAGATRAGNNFIDDRKATLGDRVWLDTDKDGQQDADEAGVAGVTVNLLDAAGTVVGTQTTNAQGNYLFTELDAGTYSVEFVKPTGLDFTSTDTGADGSDSDANQTTGRTGSYTLQSGDDNRTVDAGLVTPPPLPGTISGVVREDLNNDGTGDTPIPGVTVVLKDSAGNPVATTTTGTDGSYSFTDVPPGQYTVEETNQPGYNDVGDTDGGNPNSISVTLPAGGTSAGNDFVDDRKATLGDRVWLDTDKDGQQDADEAGVAGVTVNLLNAAGTVVGTQTTDGQGNYLFTELDAGTYSVEFVKPTGLDFTSTDTGADGSDSDANQTTGRTGSYTLQSGDDNRTVDAGLVTPPAKAVIGNLVFEDANANGVQDTGELGIAGATILLKDPSGAVVQTTTTDGNGNYSFEVDAGSYSLQVVVPADSGYSASPQDAGGDDTLDSDIDATGNTGLVTVAAGDVNNTIDMGGFRKASLGDRVWLDTDKDGQQDADEAGVAGVTVNLLNTAGTVVATQTTDGSGNYLFSDLTPGRYTVQFVKPTGFDFTSANTGDDTSDSDANTTTGTTGEVVLNSGENIRTVDAGLVAQPPAPGTISGVVREDLNNDGTGDTPIPGVTVVLKDSTGTPVATTTTGTDGSYSFTNVPPGQYTVEETNQPGYNDVSDTDGGNPNSISVTLPAGGTSAGNDFVDDRKATLGDRVWLDTDKDGQQDADEAGVAGVTVNLLDAAGTVVGTQTTDGQGNYLFTELDAGTYSVEFVKPTGFDFTSTDTGADGSDSDANQTTGRTGSYTLQSGDDNRTVDAGLVTPPAKAVIGNLVFEDANANGVQDTGELGIAGATILLKDPSGAVVQTTTTDGNGNYSFEVDAGSYSLQVVVPADSGYSASPQDAGGDDTLDSDIDATGNTGLVTVAAGEVNNTIDMGGFRKASLGDRVWLDTDKDGQQDADEAGVAGVTVNLLNTAGTVVATQTTDGSGNYLFSDLTPGRYTVQFVKPTGFDFTSANTGDDSSDSDANTTTGTTGEVVLNSGENIRTVDAGLVAQPPAPGTISGVVREDLNNDGTGDTPIPGVTVVLKDSTGTPVATTTTGTDGSYSFTNVPPGQYTVEETNQPGYNDVSDTDGGNPNSISVTLPAGGTSAGNDFVDDRKATLGDRVWLDTDKDGQQDADEAGVAGVTVNLLDAAGTVVGTQTTNAQGNYLFTELDAGTYSVEFVKPNGFDFTSRDTGADGSDSDANTTTGRTGTVTLQSGDDNRTVDAGLVVQTGTISGVVLEDQDNNNSGDRPIPGVTVVLKDAAGNPVATTTTGTDGSYSFTNVPAGSYTVEQTNLPTYGDVSDIDGGNPNSISVTLPAGGTSTGNNFVDERKATLGDRVWLDTDKDGQQDANEAGVAGVTVNLLNAAGAVVGTQTTNAQGNYLFTELDAGTYSVEFVKPTGFDFTSTDTGADGSDSDADQTTGRTGSYTLQSGDDNRTVDAGLVVQTGTISGVVLEDQDNNNSGDRPIPGVTVVLKDAAGNPVATTTTGTDGSYSFTNVPAGSYTVEQTNLPTYGDVSDIDGGNPNVISVTLPAGGTSTGNNFVDERKATLGDRVWLDTDKDGQQDANEAGVAGVTVNLLNAAGAVVGTQTTNAQGNYLFTELDAGTYSVEFVKPNGFDFTSRDTGADGSDSDANTTTGRTGTYTLQGGDDNRTVDAGLVVKQATLGDKVFEDKNANGVQDTGEAGISGVTVQLKNAAGTVVATTTTGTDGAYSFTVDPGTYSVQVTAPAGFTASPTDQGGNDATDSDINASGATGSYTLAAGQTNNTVDAGLFKKATLGDRVWLDTDKDGQQDANEAGVAGVTVRLLNAAGAVVATQTTNASGNYLFTDLTPGTYSVEFVKPNGFNFTTTDIGADASDSDANQTTGRTGAYTLQSGDDVRTVDAGLVQPQARIGDTVFLDKNGNGVQDSGEGGIANVTVNLRDSAGTVVATTTTDANGKYGFDTAPGTYTVQVVAPNGYFSAPKDQGGNDATDSDIDTNGLSPSYTLAAGENNTTVDAGLFQKASLGDKVWFDKDRDGVQDADEPGISHVTVKLLDAAGNVVATTETDAGGNYLFTNLNPGSYAVQFVAPTGYGFTKKDLGGDDTKDSDADLSTGKTAYTTLESGEVERGLDAGINPICRPVSYDFNGNTATDGTDGNVRSWTDGATGVVVTARAFSQDKGTNTWQNAFVGSYGGGLGVTDSSEGTGSGTAHTVDNTGRNNYIVLQFSQAVEVDKLFLGYVSGDSDIQVWVGNSATTITGMNNSVLAGMSFTEVNTTTATTSRWADINAGGVVGNVLIVAADTAGSNDFFKLQNVALCAPDLTTPSGKVGSIGNLVFEDLNYNGVQDAGEKGIAGVTVKLTNNSGTVLATTTTDANGGYLFSNLGAGDYKVQVASPTGYFVTKSDQGADDALDSDLLATGSTGTITLAAGQNRSDVDAGLYRKASLGDRVWSDANHNGVQDNGEGGIGGIKVSLLNAAGTTVLATTTTNSSGNYLFSGLNPGDYVVQFDKTNVVFSPSWFQSYNLNTWSWSAKDVGSDGADSDVNNAGSTAGTARTGVINLVSGESDNTVDAGLTPIVIDLDGNGIQTVSRENAGGTFDLFGNGSAVASGWVGQGDGLLAVDKNGNGRIDDITELFGGTRQGAGFAQLAAYDSNGDGRVDSADADFDQLLVWVDANGNHATDAGELQSLAQAGLASLSTGFTSLPAVDDQGNLHLERGSATRTDGSTVDMTDVYFNVSVADADAAGVALPTIAQLLGDDSALDSLLAGSGLSAAPAVGASAVGADLMACGEAAELLRHLSALTQAETHMAMAA